MSKVFRLIVDEDNEPVILEEDEVLEDILFYALEVYFRNI